MPKKPTFNNGRIKPGIGRVKPIGRQHWFEAFNGDILIVERGRLAYRQKRLC